MSTDGASGAASTLSASAGASVASAEDFSRSVAAPEAGSSSGAPPQDPASRAEARRQLLHQRRAQSAQGTGAGTSLLRGQLSPFQVVYGTGSTAGSEESSRVMSEKVQMLASSIYKELELIIQQHGGDCVKVTCPGRTDPRFRS